MFRQPGDAMRASRLLTIQMLLQSRGRLSARALAEALQVSVRTLYRDVDQLSAAGVPVYAERGRHGGFCLREGWQTSLTGLTAAESQAVLLSGLPGPAAQLGLGGAAASARLKLLSALPADGRAQALRMGDQLHLDPVDWYREAEPTPHLATVADALWQGRRLQVHYESWTATTTRTVDPLGLVLKAGTWYLVAAVRGSPRTWRVAAIRQALALPAPVQRPPRFDLAAWWAESTRRFESELMRAEATVLATPQGLRDLRRLSAAAARAVAAAPAARRADGRVRLQLPIESIAQASSLLLPLAPGVEAVAPAELRAAVVARIGKAARCYRTLAAARR
jgi:predicted DNA-binding transcriptional regulator YafY